MAIKVNGNIVVNDSLEAVNVASISFSDGTTQTSAGGTSFGTSVYAAGELIHTLNNPNVYSTPANDWFGYSVAISSQYALVGAYQEDDTGGLNSGKAYIFNVTTGALLHTLDNPNAYGNALLDQFGISVALSDTYAIVGATGESDTGGSTSGKVYIFDVASGSLIRTITNPNAFGSSVTDTFGISVALSGNYLIVGAYWEGDAGGTTSGKAYIFDISTGSLVHTLNNPNAYGTSAGDYFGYSTAISGNLAIVGAYLEDDAGGSDSGKAYIFNVATGSLVHTLNNPNPFSTSTSDYFSYSVAISSQYALVGAYQEDDAVGTNSGKVYIFNVINGALVYTLNDPNIDGSSSSDRFGYSIAVSGNLAIIGADGDNGGRSHIFDVSTGSLIRTLSNPNPYGANNDSFSSSVSVSGKYALVGAYNEDEISGDGSGKAYIFALEDVVKLSNISSINFSSGRSISADHKAFQTAHVFGELMNVLRDPLLYSADDRFGYECAIYKNYCVISAVHQQSGFDTVIGGRILVFDIVQGRLLFQINNPFQPGYDLFGNTVDICQKYVIAGSYKSNQAHIYDRLTGRLLHTLDNPNAYSTAENDYFGLGLAISDEYCVVSAPLEDTGSFLGGDGMIYVFSPKTGALLYSFSGEESSNGGETLAISGEYLVVGQPRYNFSSGRITIHKLYPTYQTKIHTINNPNAYSTTSNDYFGSAVEIYGDYCIAGAISRTFGSGEDDAGGSNSGKAYIFNVSTGSLVHVLNNPNAGGSSASDGFGRDVDISDKYCIVGAAGDADPNGAGSGRAYIFDVKTGELVLVLTNPNSFSTSAADGFGSSVAIYGDYAVVGAPGEDGGYKLPGGQPTTEVGGIGVAYVFSISEQTYLDKITNLVA